jgi:hypothetical protein
LHCAFAARNGVNAQQLNRRLILQGLPQGRGCGFFHSTQHSLALPCLALPCLALPCLEDQRRHNPLVQIAKRPNTGPSSTPSRILDQLPTASSLPT